MTIIEKKFFVTVILLLVAGDGHTKGELIPSNPEKYPKYTVYGVDKNQNGVLDEQEELIKEELQGYENLQKAFLYYYRSRLLVLRSPLADRDILHKYFRDMGDYGGCKAFLTYYTVGWKKSHQIRNKLLSMEAPTWFLVLVMGITQSRGPDQSGKVSASPTDDIQKCKFDYNGKEMRDYVKTWCHEESIVRKKKACFEFLKSGDI